MGLVILFGVVLEEDKSFSWGCIVTKASFLVVEMVSMHLLGILQPRLSVQVFIMIMMVVVVMMVMIPFHEYLLHAKQGAKC